MICDLDPATWLRTGEVSDPGDLRKSSLAHAVAIPGLAFEGATISAAAPALVAADAEIGGSADAAALASKLNQLIDILLNWTPAPPDGGAALQTAIKLAFDAPPGTWAAGTKTSSQALKLGS